MKYLNEQEIVQYCKNNNIDPSICYCKECGKFLAYDNAVFHLHTYTGKLICDDNKLSFLSTINYNGNETDYFILGKERTVKDKWQHDKERIDDIQQTLNCKIIIVWESTYKNDKKGTIKSLIQMINNKEQLNDITEI